MKRQYVQPLAECAALLYEDYCILTDSPTGEDYTDPVDYDGF